MTREELNRQARAALESRRQRAETAALERREQLYAAIPELAMLDQKQTEAGVTAARFAADGRGAEAGKYLDAVRDIAARRTLLLGQHGLAPNALDIQYTCPDCSDSGRLPDGRACSCLSEEIKRLRRAGINGAGPLKLCRFENFSLDKYPERIEGISVNPREQMASILAGCREYARDFSPASHNLFLYGDAGLGKTHLALSIASEVLDKGFDVIYVSAQSAFAEVSAERFNGGGALLASMLDADLLVLDDLGTEFLDAYVLSRLYELVNTRLRRPTIYTSNIFKREVLEGRYTEKISSRLLGECQLMRFFGQDIRLQRG